MCLQIEDCDENDKVYRAYPRANCKVASASCSRRVPMICSSLKRFRCIVRPVLQAELYFQLDQFFGGRSMSLSRRGTQEVHSQASILQCQSSGPSKR